MDWLQISIECPTETGDAVVLEENLLALGAESVSLTPATDTELYEPAPGETPLWPSSWVTGLFPATVDPAHVLFSLQARLKLAALPRYRVESLAERDWVRASTADLKPMRFGRRLWVCPTGHEVTEPDAVVVQLDPGLAFGTGTHPSTALCLAQLDAGELAGDTVMDYGCGSGVLALAAAALGARMVYAVDIDPQALQATQDNATRNSVSGRIQALSPEPLDVPPVDLLVANILSGPLVQLAPRFSGLVKPGGRLLLAGLLEEDARDLRAAYAGWFALPQTATLDGWLCLAGTRLHTGNHG